MIVCLQFFIFKEIGDKMGPFDLALIPIGAYSPRWFMSNFHCSPEDAVDLHRDIKRTFPCTCMMRFGMLGAKVHALFVRLELSSN